MNTSAPNLSELHARLKQFHQSQDEFDHALQVENKLVELIQSNELSLSTEESTLVRTAALLHNLPGETFSINPSGSKTITSDYLSGLLDDLPFYDKSRYLDKTLRLVESHDSTVNLFPSVSSSGAITEAQESSTGLLADILKEADALVHALPHTIQLLIDRWSATELQIVNPKNNGLIPLCWGHSILGNLRLIGRRVLLDSKTNTGRKEAILAYRRLESKVSDQTNSKGVLYRPEPKLIENFLSAGENSYEVGSNVQLQSFVMWGTLRERLANTPLVNTPSSFPYADSKIDISQIRVSDVHPLANYVLNENYSRVHNLYVMFFRLFGIDILNLTGVIRFRIDSRDHVISPPILERIEVGPNESPLAIVDGLHRCRYALAKEHSIFSGIEISNIRYPLPFRAYDWVDLTHLDTLPQNKRNLLFATLDEYVEHHDIDTGDITGTFPSCLYRDFDFLGSTGERTHEQ